MGAEHAPVGCLELSRLPLGDIEILFGVMQTFILSPSRVLRPASSGWATTHSALRLLATVLTGEN